MTAPTSQKNRPIAFILQDTGKGDPFKPNYLTIRPEELTLGQTSRLAVQQTLGGAWADSFGEGVETINISGHTGWGDLGDGADGLQRFLSLNKESFKGWHGKRATAISEGRNPDDVQLIFADMLDRLTRIVAPMAFTLRRSKSRPLLMQYQISMLVLKEGVATLEPTSSNPFGSIGAALATLKDVVKKIRAFVQGIAKAIRSVGAMVRDFMYLTYDILNLVTDSLATLGGAVNSIIMPSITIAKNISQAGRNLFHGIAASSALSAFEKALAMNIGGTYSNAFCVLNNAFSAQKVYPDYTPLYGASNCSSTSGGRPLSPLRDENPFYRLSPTPPAPPIMQTPPAQAATAALAGADILSMPVDNTMANRVKAISSGTTVMVAAA